MAYADYYNAICHKLQNAAAAMLRTLADNGDITLIGSSSITPGIGGGSLAIPRVVCISKNAQAEINASFLGNWNSTLTINVIAETSDTSEDDFHELCGQVYSYFLQAPDTVCGLLSNAVIKFTAFTIYPISQSWDIVADGNNSRWESELNLTVRCCGSVVA